jgi:outer membrane protein
MMKLTSTLALAAALSCAAGGASAQAQANRPAQSQQAPALTHGAAVPGVCVISQAAAVGGSAAGQSVNNRLRQLGEVVQAELRPEATAIQTEQGALQQVADKNTPAFQQRVQAFQQRVASYEQKANLRAQELEATRNEQLARIGAELNPIVSTVYQQRNCSILVDASAVFAYNPAMDITPTVIQQLNAKLPSLTFDRRRLDQQPAAQPAAAQRN